MRESFIENQTIHTVCNLGTRCFESITGEVVNAALVIYSCIVPAVSAYFASFNVNIETNPGLKAAALLTYPVSLSKQLELRRNSEIRIIASAARGGRPLDVYCDVFEGISRGDTERFDRGFWEIPIIEARWKYLCASGGSQSHYSGRSTIFLWEHGNGALALSPSSRVQGLGAWGKDAIFIERTGELKARLTNGYSHAQNCVALVPKNSNDLNWLFCYVSSAEYRTCLKNLANKLILPTGVYLACNVDAPLWVQIAGERYVKGIPEPYSDDPTQWLFHGHPAHAAPGTELHVALARLAGYRWPAETDADMSLAKLARERISASAELSDADENGLLPLHATAQNKTLAGRLRNLLATAYGGSFTNVQEQALIRSADLLLDKKEARDVSLEAWLRDRAFRQHCILFHHHPFLWQVWDGGKGGFSAFVNYHRLDLAMLEKLTYTVLGDWTARMRAEGRTAEEGWALQLRQRLVAIIEGEDPYDIFVRWKSMALQPVGWDPDLDDGFRVNIRPFVRAGVLRDQLRVNWKKDRGTDVASAPWHHLGAACGGKEGDRINDHHLTLTEKRAAHREANVS